MRVKPWIMAALLAGLSAGSAMAEDAKFKLVLRGIPAGSLSWSGKGEPGGAYAVTGILRTSGLAAMLKKVRYEAGAKGRAGGVDELSPGALALALRLGLLGR